MFSEERVRVRERFLSKIRVTSLVVVDSRCFYEQEVFEKKFHIRVINLSVFCSCLSIESHLL